MTSTSEPDDDVPEQPTADGPSMIEIDDVVHQRVRLGIMTLLADGDAIEFAGLRNTLGLTDGNLARHLSVLERAGHLRRDRNGGDGGRTRTWLSITAVGRNALSAEVDALRRLIERLDRTLAPTDGSAAGSGEPSQAQAVPDDEDTR